MALALGLAARPAEALPRYSAATGAPCAACHMNPTGGGMRNRYGRYFAKDLLPWGGGRQAAPAEDAGGAWGFDPQVTRWLSFGSDFRFAWLFDRLNLPDGSTLTAQNQFFPMQLDLYIGAELGDHLILYADAGLIGSRSYEAFGIFHWGLTGGHRPYAVYLKGGHFFPTYGLRFDNHFFYTRERLGFGALTRGDGIEFGFVGKNHTGQVGYFLGGTDPSAVSHGITFRTDYHLRTRFFRLIPGVSVLFARNGNVPVFPPAPLADPNFPAMLAAGADPNIVVQREIRAAGHILIGLGRFRYLGEIDVIRQQRALRSMDPTQPDAPPTPLDNRLSLATYQQLGMVVRRGIDVSLTHEYIDPDTSIRGLANPARLQQSALNRVGAQIYWNALAGGQLQLHYYYTLGDAQDLEDTRSTVILMLHLFI